MENYFMLEEVSVSWSASIEGLLKMPRDCSLFAFLRGHGKSPQLWRPSEEIYPLYLSTLRKQWSNIKKDSIYSWPQRVIAIKE